MIRKMQLCIVVLCLSATSGMAQLWDWDTPSKNDKPEPVAAQPRGGDAPWNAFLGVTLDSTAGAEDFDTVEFGWNWDIATSSARSAGDFEFALEWYGMFFSSSAGIGLPDQVSRIVFDVEHRLGFRNGMVLETHLKPGMYFDLDEFDSDAIMVPFSLQLWSGLGSSLGGTIGLDFRSDFERELLPILGLRWNVNDATTLDLMIPKSLLRIRAGRDWQFWAGYAWENMDYALSEDKSDQEQIAIEDFRLSLGASYRMRNGLGLTLEYGRLTNRSVEFRASSNEIDISDEGSIRVGVGGPF